MAAILKLIMTNPTTLTSVLTGHELESLVQQIKSHACDELHPNISLAYGLIFMDEKYQSKIDFGTIAQAHTKHQGLTEYLLDQSKKQTTKENDRNIVGNRDYNPSLHSSLIEHYFSRFDEFHKVIEIEMREVEGAKPLTGFEDPSKHLAAFHEVFNTTFHIAKYQATNKTELFTILNSLHDDWLSPQAFAPRFKKGKGMLGLSGMQSALGLLSHYGDPNAEGDKLLEITKASKILSATENYDPILFSIRTYAIRESFRDSILIRPKKFSELTDRLNLLVNELEDFVPNQANLEDDQELGMAYTILLKSVMGLVDQTKDSGMVNRLNQQFKTAAEKMDSNDDCEIWHRYKTIVDTTLTDLRHSRIRPQDVENKVEIRLQNAVRGIQNRTNPAMQMIQLDDKYSDFKAVANEFGAMIVDLYSSYVLGFDNLDMHLESTVGNANIFQAKYWQQRKQRQKREQLLTKINGHYENLSVEVKQQHGLISAFDFSKFAELNHALITAAADIGNLTNNQIKFLDSYIRDHHRFAVPYSVQRIGSEFKTRHTADNVEEKLEVAGFHLVEIYVPLPENEITTEKPYLTISAFVKACKNLEDAQAEASAIRFAHNRGRLDYKLIHNYERINIVEKGDPNSTAIQNMRPKL